MCLGNRAESSSYYINSQLRSLWETSQRCVEKHGNGLKPSRSEIEYGFALSEFYYGKHNRYHPSKDDLSFHATFGCPRLEFVCNHEAILYLDLKEGHYHVDIAKAPRSDVKHSFNGCTVAFRLEFTTHSVRDISCTAIGNADTYTLDLVIMDMDSVEFCDHLSHLPGVTSVEATSAIIHYLSKYYFGNRGLLKRAGHHVLHSIPDFDNLTRTQIIDYSIIANRSLTTTEIFGVRVAEVNTFLKGLWLQAAAHIDEHGTGNDHSSYSSFYLAEHRSAWTEAQEDVQFHAFFGPLQVQPLCKREVVLYLDVQDVHFFMGRHFASEPHHKFSDWKIALIVDIAFEESEQGTVRKLKLNLSTARFCEQLSTLAAQFEDLGLLQRLRSTLVRYITVRYLGILQEAGHHTVYHKDARIIHVHREDEESGPETDEELGCWCEDEADCGHPYVHGHVYWGRLFKERLAHSYVHGYDLVTAVSQSSMNKHWKLLWEVAFRKAEALGLHDHHGAHSNPRSLEIQLGLCLADYVFENDGHVHFTCSFGTPQIQLLCGPGSQKVVIYFHLKEGYMKALANKQYCPSGPEHHFSDWIVAFEVELKLRDSRDNDQVSDAILKHLGHLKYDILKQLVLDFSTATFSDSRSTVPGLLDGEDFRLIRSKREALLHYFIHHYFPILGLAGYSVLYSLPIWKKESNSHAITSLAFQICPFTFGPAHSFVEGLRGRQRALFDRNMIVFLGVTGNRALPSGPLPYGNNWVCGVGKEISLGTVCLSRRTFLEGRLLSLLARINSETTVVPSFSDVEDGQWNLQLTTWDKHPSKKNRDCRWKESQNVKGHALEFDWSNRDRWSYDHEGDDGSNGSYRVSCDTHNKLSIPTAASGDACAIVMTGSVDLKLSFEGSSKHWHTEVSARWTATITMTSHGDHGLKVQTSPDSIIPEFVNHRNEGGPNQSTFGDACAHLKAQLPAVISFEHVVDVLKSSFEGVWPLLSLGSGNLCVTNPVFSNRGDLLLELKPHLDAVQQHHRMPTASDQGEQNRNGWFRNLTEKVEHVLETQLSLQSPPPNYSPPGSTRSKAGYFLGHEAQQVAATEGLSDIESDL